MEVKKSDKANLELKKLLYFECGLVLSLLLIWAAFEWKSEKQEKGIWDSGLVQRVNDEEDMLNVEQPDIPPPPPEEVAAPDIPALSDQIEFVDDTSEEVLIDTEDDNSAVEIKEYVAAVEEEVVEEEAIPFQLVEKQPSFMGGGPNEFTKWVNSRLVYPEIAKENGVQGRVTLQFTVEKDGRVTNVKVLRGVDPALDEEAKRVVASSPKWTPGRQRDRAVKVNYTFPVIFQLR